MKKIDILALIPARGGSKGIPGKNIIKIGDYPLMAYSIAAANLSRHINRVIVTTDDDKIAAIAGRFGAETPFLRPKTLAGDRSLDIDFFLHALNWLKTHESYVPDLIAHLRPTTPFRDFRVVDKAIEEMIEDPKATSLRSAYLIERESPYKWFKKKGLYWDFFGKEDFRKNEEYYNYPRQMFPATYQPDGYIDIIRTKYLLKTGLLHGRRIRAFVTAKTPELDNMGDVIAARKAAKVRKYTELIRAIKTAER